MSPKIDMAKLSSVFWIVATHFNLSISESVVAWKIATEKPQRAWRCYSAIAASLRGS